MTEPTASTYAFRLAPGTFTEELGNVKRLISLSGWQYIVILGIAVSGLAAFINTYEAIAGTNDTLKACTESETYKKQINTEFIVLLILSILAILIGAVLAWALRNQGNQRNLITLGIMTVGFFGIIYAISLKFQNVTSKIKLGISWISFLAFIILGFFMSSGVTQATAIPGSSASAWNLKL